MADWNTVRHDPYYPESLDPEIIPLCDALNTAGFVTTSSCCGHGRDWPHVWFEHSTDARIEALARFVMLREGGDLRPYFSMWQKDIRPDGYAWSLEIHLNKVYQDTTPEVVAMEAEYALARTTEAIRVYAAGEALKARMAA
jgi:hypothetical protein